MLVDIIDLGYAFVLGNLPKRYCYCYLFARTVSQFVSRNSYAMSVPSGFFAI